MGKFIPLCIRVFAVIQEWVECSNCFGKGRVDDHECTYCLGRGLVWVDSE